MTAYEYSACVVSHYHSGLAGGGSNLWVQYVHLVSVAAAAVQKKRKRKEKGSSVSETYTAELLFGLCTQV